MPIWTPEAKPSVLLRQAIADGLKQNFSTLTQPEKGTFCALGAIYREYGLTFEELSANEDEVEEAREALFDGILVHHPDYTWQGQPTTSVDQVVIYLNDSKKQSFKQIAEYLETVGL